MIFQEPQSASTQHALWPQVMERLQQNKIGKPQDYRNRVLEAFEQVNCPSQNVFLAPIPMNSVADKNKG